MFKRAYIFYVLLYILSAVTSGRAESFYKEAIVIGGYDDNQQWIGGGSTGIKNSVGIEYFNKFSNEYGDYLTADLQLRSGYDFFEDGKDAFGVEFHNAYLEYKLGLGESVRLGHFDPALGLEPVLDTHGTLLQTLASKSIGFKKDWGIAYRSFLGNFDYEIAAQLGSGMTIRNHDNNFLLSTRIGNPETEEFRYGFSFLYGQTLMSEQSWTIPAPDLVAEATIRKTRFALDVRFPLGSCDFLGEIEAGDNEGTTVGGALAELIYPAAQWENLVLKLQGKYWSNDWDNDDYRDLTIAPVIEYKLDSTKTLRLGYFHDLYSPAQKNWQVLLQFYYYGF